MTVVAETADATESDAELIGRAVRQPEAFAALFDRHYRRIYAYACRRLGAGIAEDVAAETFLIAFDRRDRYDLTRADAGPWLYGEAEAIEFDAAAVAGRLDASAVRGRLAEALAALPAAEREVLLLVAWAGLSGQDVAVALDIPAGTARSRLHRARGQMRAALGLNLDTEMDA